MLSLFLISGSLPWSQKVQGLMLTAFFGFLIQRASSQDAITAAVGETVTFPVPVTGSIVIYFWYRGTAVSNDRIILSFNGPGQPPLPGPQYTHRESAVTDGSLQITNVQRNDTGNYTGTIQVEGLSPTTFTRQLRVYEKVPKPTVSINVSQPNENQPVALTCNNSNSATTILWFFNNKPLQPDNNTITLSADNRMLTISTVSQSDDGSYQCEAQNPVSNSTSDPLTLTVSFGPDRLVITPSQNVEVKLGTELRLTCTAASYPAAQYQWLHNGTSINNPQSTYTKASSTFDDSGSYTCLASNSVTGLSANSSIIVKLSVTGPSISNPCSCWEVTLGVAIGVFLCATAVISGVVFYYKRLLTQKETRKDDVTFQNHSTTQKPEAQYENLKKEHKMHFANPPTSTDSPYMGLQHGDHATYEQIKRACNMEITQHTSK